MLPGPSVLERLMIRVCSTAHLALFESIYQHLSPELRDVIEAFLKPPEGEQRSTFYELKAYPPSASISSLQHYLKRYAMLSEAHLEQFQSQSIGSGLPGLPVQAGQAPTAPKTLNASIPISVTR